MPIEKRPCTRSMFYKCPSPYTAHCHFGYTVLSVAKTISPSRASISLECGHVQIRTYRFQCIAWRSRQLCSRAREHSAIFDFIKGEAKSALMPSSSIKLEPCRGRMNALTPQSSKQDYLYEDQDSISSLDEQSMSSSFITKRITNDQDKIRDKTKESRAKAKSLAAAETPS